MVDENFLVANHAGCFQSDLPRLWVFGYGSLLWKPGFEYNSMQIGYIENYERRFNQGNETFRGTPEKPGRVANLEKKTGSRVWGVAYEVIGRAEVISVLRNLYVREISCGGYDVTTTTFFPRQQSIGHVSSVKTICIASHTENSHRVLEDSNHVCRCKSSAEVNSPCTSLESHLHAFAPFSSSAVSCPEECIQVPVSSSPSPISSHVGKVVDFDSGVESDANGNGSDDDYGDFAVLKNHEQVHPECNAMSPPSDYALPNTSAHPPTTTASSCHSNSGSKCPCLLQNEAVPQNTALVTSSSAPSCQKDFPSNTQVLVFTATSDNALYLQQESVDHMARQIVEAEGSAGSNVEYVLRISEFVRQNIPEDQDHFLFELDSKIREELVHRNEDGLEAVANPVLSVSERIPSLRVTC